MNFTKLKQFIACILQAFSCVLASALTSIVATFDVFCLFCKSILQEKNLQFKIILFYCKKILSSARQATYNQLPLEELKTMNFIQSILNFFGRRETKRQGKYSYELRKDLKAEQERLLRIINKENTRANLRAYKNQMTWIGNKEGKQ